MSSFNKTFLLGNLTRDVDLRFTPNGKAVCDLGIAVNRQWKTEAGEKKEETTFVDVTFFGRTAEIAAEFLKKGSPAFIEGRLSLDTWEDKKTGDKRSKLKVIGEQLQLLGGKRE